MVACSALKRSYRDLLREHAPAMMTVFARGDLDLISSRVTARRHEYMPPSLLGTQVDDLEERQPDEAGVTVNIADSPPAIIDQIITAITRTALSRPTNRSRPERRLPDPRAVPGCRTPVDYRPPNTGRRLTADGSQLTADG